MPSVIVVGAGVIGCAVARQLAVRGADVTILDDRPVAGGATQASAGMLAPYVEAHERGPLLDLGIRSLALYDDWIAAVRRESGQDVEYRRIGTLEIALDPPHAADLQAQASTDPRREWLAPDDVRSRVPALAATAGALFTAVHGYVAAPALTSALALSATRAGARVIASRVTRIDPDGSGLRVETTQGPLAAERIVLAAGAWTGAIRLPGAPPLLRPVRGQLLHLAWHGPRFDTILWGPECYIVPRTDGTMLVGATVEDVGFDERATAAGVRDLLDAACDLLPAGWGASFLGVRVGLRPATPDELPVIGPDPRVPGLVHASGHYRNGVLLAPITAALVAGFVLDGARDPMLEALAANRFAA